MLSVYREKGNHWKEISTYFKGRTDNATKNQFFSLIRKGLRKACKKIGRTSNTVTINRMKPKVLSEFFNLIVPVMVPGEDHQPIERRINIGEFIERFAFSRKNDATCTPEEQQEIIAVIEYLNKLKFANKRNLR